MNIENIEILTTDDTKSLYLDDGHYEVIRQFNIPSSKQDFYFAVCRRNRKYKYAIGEVKSDKENIEWTNYSYEEITVLRDGAKSLCEVAERINNLGEIKK